MAKAAAHFDAETIALMKLALDEAWGRLPPKMQATVLKTTLAERILKSAAEGERSRERLLDAALRDREIFPGHPHLRGGSGGFAPDPVRAGGPALTRAGPPMSI